MPKKAKVNSSSKLKRCMTKNTEINCLDGTKASLNRGLACSNFTAIFLDSGTAAGIAITKQTGQVRLYNS